jgi:hypothetical protein
VLREGGKLLHGDVPRRERTQAASLNPLTLSIAQ